MDTKIRQPKIEIKALNIFQHKTTTVSQITTGYPCPTLLIISLEIDRTRIISLHAHPQIVYCNCVKFHQYWLIG